MWKFVTLLSCTVATLAADPLPAFAQQAGGGGTGAQGGGGTKIDASRGGVTIASGVNSLTINARAQIRWTLDDREAFDADTAGGADGREDAAVSAFDVPRLRLTLSGGALKPWLRYSFQFEMGRTAGEGGSRIKDAILEIRPEGRSYRILTGQFKVPFGLQQLASSGRLQFVDRSITDAKFTPGRDMGVMLSGTAVSRRIGYDVGLFNGAGESLRQNTSSHLWAARVYADPLGAYPLAEGTGDPAKGRLLHLGAAVRGGKQVRGRTAAGVVDEADDQTAWNVEAGYRTPRLFATAEYFWMSEEQRNPVRGPDIDSRGYHVQAGVMALPPRLEVGLLWAQIDGDTSRDDAAVDELRGVVNWYLQAHSLKVQADAGRVGYGARFGSLSARARQGLPAIGTRLASGEPLSDTQVRVQFQLTF